MADRAGNGRFLPAHGLPGPGRPPRAVEEEYLVAVRSAVSPEDLAAVARAVVERAKSGDVQAAKVVLQLFVRDPRPMAEVPPGPTAEERAQAIITEFMGSLPADLRSRVVKLTMATAE